VQFVVIITIAAAAAEAAATLMVMDCLTITGLDRTYHAHHFVFSFTF